MHVAKRSDEHERVDHFALMTEILATDEPIACEGPQQSIELDDPKDGALSRDALCRQVGPLNVTCHQVS